MVTLPCWSALVSLRLQLTTLVIDNPTAQRPRQVGICLKHLPSNTDERFNHENVPWQRVINAKGMISPRLANPITSKIPLTAQISTSRCSHTSHSSRSRRSTSNNKRIRRALCRLFRVRMVPRNITIRGKRR